MLSQANWCVLVPSSSLELPVAPRGTWLSLKKCEVLTYGDLIKGTDFKAVVQDIYSIFFSDLRIVRTCDVVKGTIQSPVSQMRWTVCM